MDLSTSYLGLKLSHPIVASASPLARDLDGIRRLEDAGAAAVVLPSIFEEEVEAEEAAQLALIEQGSYAHAEATGYFPSVVAPGGGLGARLDTLARATAACRIPIIASLNGSTPTGWVEFARELVDAGAAAIELNLYRVPADPTESGTQVEERWLDTLRAVRAAVRVPIAVKLGPWLSSPGHFAKQLAEAGADGLVLFNRFYEPDIDLATLQPRPDLKLSSPYEMRLALLWIALLAGKVPASLAGTSGVESHEEVVKYLLVGADAVMTTSALLRHGPGHLRTLLRGLDEWLAGRGFRSLAEVRGRLTASRVADPEAFVRAQYVHILTGYHTAAPGAHMR